MLLNEYEKSESVEALKELCWYALLICSVVFIQQTYARTHQSSIEQPIGLVGFAEYFFRHPETFFGLHFEYPISRFEGDHLGY